MLFFICMDIGHAMYSVVRLCKYENALLYMCLIYPCFIIDQVWQYLYIVHNNVTHTSNESEHV